MNVREAIILSLKSATGFETIHLGFTDRPEHGDYTTNVALQSGKNPREFATELVEKLNQNPELKKIISKIEIAGPGYINFFLSDAAIIDEVNTALSKNSDYGKTSAYNGKKIIVEYSSPNIAKPFTIGHFRSTIIGDAVANLLETQGYEVFRDNHIGDWGTQFGKQICAIKHWGDEDKIENSNSPVKELVALYMKFHEEAEKNPELENEARLWFKKLEDNDSEARRLWQKCIDWSWKEFDAIYKKLGVTFTENNGKGYGESFFEDKMNVVIAELHQKGLIKDGEEGAKLVFFDNEKYPPLMILKKDGATLYATRDLAADKWRLANERYGKDITIVNEVGGEQSLYFNQLYEVEKMLGWITDGQRIHLKHGLFRFKDKKMSTRKGNVIWLSDVLSEAHEKALKLSGKNQDEIETVSTGALKWNELKRDPVSDIIFDWDEVLNMKGNSGPYLQYTTVRINSLLSKSAVDTPNLSVVSDTDNKVIRDVIKFPEILQFAAQKLQPSYVAEYLYSLASTFNTFYDSNRIIESENEAEYIAVASAVGIVLTNGLKILGIRVPSKM